MRLEAAIIVVALMALILAIGCSYDAKRRISSMDIWEAVEREDLDAIESYVQNGGDLEVGARVLGKTPLLHALLLNKKESYSKLLSLGADPNTECRGGGEIRPPNSSVMHHTALEADPFWLRAALESDGDPNLMNHAEGMLKGTLLCFAIGGDGGIGHVRLLCEHGADVNLPADHLGKTPLGLACAAANFEMVHYLLEQGADPADAGSAHVSYSFMARIRDQKDQRWNADSERWIQAILDWLNERGMDPDAATWDGSRWTWEE